MNIPDDLKYTKEHEWVKVDGKFAIVGVTDYAAEQLGDIVYAELPKVGEEITKDDAFGVLESVKAVSDCYAPLSGKVVEINDALADNPESVNEAPYGDGWMIRIEINNPSEIDNLMDHNEYKAFIAEEKA